VEYDLLTDIDDMWQMTWMEKSLQKSGFSYCADRHVDARIPWHTSGARVVSIAFVLGYHVYRGGVADVKALRNPRIHA
jgi:hypothetical protein